MRVFFFIFLTLFSYAHASKLSRNSFQLHVRPQLVGIYQDFRQILGNFTDYPPEVLQLLTTMDRLHEASQSFKKICPLRATTDCLPILQTLVKETRELERLFLRYQSSMKFSAVTGLAPVSGQQIWLKLDKTRSTLQNTVEIEILSLSAGRNRERVSSGEVIKLIDEIDSFSTLLVVAFIPPKFQTDFRSAWMNFFRPLHRQAELAGNISFLTSNLDNLNFYWNLLNMRMTKRLKKTPEGMGGPLNAIQNRWNQVIRINYAQ